MSHLYRAFLQHLFLLLCIWIATASAAFAEQKQQFENYDIHYSLVNTTFLSPEVARAYKITRGKNRALVNIAIRKIIDDKTDTAQKASLTGDSNDLMRRYPLKFTEIIEKDSIYYIAEMKFYNLETRHFTIDVTPAGTTKTYTLKFSKTLYKD